MSADELLTAQQAARLSGPHHQSCLPATMAKGTGPLSHKRNGRIMFRRSDIDAYLERQRVRTLRGEGV